MNNAAAGGIDGSPREDATGHRQSVLHVITGLLTGGAEKALVQVAAGLRDLGVTSSVVAFRDGPVREELQQLGIRTTILTPARPGAFIAHLRSLRRAPAPQRPTVVQGWMYHANLAGLAYGRMLGIPVAWGIHQNIGDGRFDKLTTRMVIRAGARLSNRADATIFTSKSCMRQHLEHGYTECGAVVIPNGFDVRQFSPNEEFRHAIRDELQLPRTAFVVGHVARLHKVKNHAMFIRVAKQVLDSRDDAHVVMVGRDVGRTESVVRREIAGTRYASRIHLLDERQDPARLFCAMDLVCLTSWSESFPGVIGEAMACGVTCVSTDVGDVRDLIGSTGVVVPIDDAEAMASAVLQAASLGAQKRAEIGRQCRERIIFNFSASTVARRYRDLYLAMCQAEEAMATRRLTR